MCGECVCDVVDQSDSSVRYQGEYCQYDPSDCPVGRDENGDFAPCASKCTPFCVCVMYITSLPPSHQIMVIVLMACVSVTLTLLEPRASAILMSLPV